MRGAMAYRFVRLVAAVWLIVTLAFLAVYALPGDPARLILGQRATVENLERFRGAAGLDKPLIVQYIGFLARSSRLDFGESLVQRRPVSELITDRAPHTLTLVFVALGLMCVFAFILPITLAVLKPLERSEWMSALWGAFGAVPPYVLAVLALVVFGSGLGWVPLIFNPDRSGSWLLPALVLAAYPVAIVLKLFHQELVAAQSQPYVLRAKAFGFMHRSILLAEIVPNALTPALAALANSVAFFVTGTFFVEVVFGITGLGSLTYEAVRNKDLPLLLGLCVVFSVSITLISGLMEIALAWANPQLRVRHG